MKTRIVAGSTHTARQQVVRVDRGTAFPLDAAARATLAAALRRASRGATAVVLSDYGYDSVTPELARIPVRRWRARGVTVGLDARYRLARYRGVSLATPNEGEAAAAPAARSTTSAISNARRANCAARCACGTSSSRVGATA